jgi:hypothetical protein
MKKLHVSIVIIAISLMIGSPVYAFGLGDLANINQVVSTGTGVVNLVKSTKEITEPNNPANMPYPASNLNAMVSMTPDMLTKISVNFSYEDLDRIESQNLPEQTKAVIRRLREIKRSTGQTR